MSGEEFLEQYDRGKFDGNPDEIAGLASVLIALPLELDVVAARVLHVVERNQLRIRVVPVEVHRRHPNDTATQADTR